MKGHKPSWNPLVKTSVWAGPNVYNQSHQKYMSLKNPEPLYGNTRPSYITLPETKIATGNPPVWWYSPRVQMEKISWANCENPHRRKEVEYSRTPPGAGPGWCKVTPFVAFRTKHVMDVSFDSDILMLQLDWTMYIHVCTWYDMIWCDMMWYDVIW